MSFRTTGGHNTYNGIQKSEDAGGLFDVTGEKRGGSILHRRSDKNIKYPIKDLFPADDDEEEASGSGNKRKKESPNLYSFFAINFMYAAV